MYVVCNRNNLPVYIFYSLHDPWIVLFQIVKRKVPVSLCVSALGTIYMTRPRKVRPHLKFNYTKRILFRIIIVLKKSIKKVKKKVLKKVDFELGSS